MIQINYNDLQLISLGEIDKKVLGPFPLFVFVYGVNCQDGISLKLTMSKQREKGEIVEPIINEMEFECSEFPYYFNIHFTIPHDKQKIIYDTFMNGLSRYNFKLKFE